jgi:hypothetical protein
MAEINRRELGLMSRACELQLEEIIMKRNPRFKGEPFVS